MAQKRCMLKLPIWTLGPRSRTLNYLIWWRHSHALTVVCRSLPSVNQDCSLFWLCKLPIDFNLYTSCVNILKSNRFKGTKITQLLCTKCTFWLVKSLWVIVPINSHLQLWLLPIKENQTLITVRKTIFIFSHEKLWLLYSVTRLATA